MINISADGMKEMLARQTGHILTAGLQVKHKTLNTPLFLIDEQLSLVWDGNAGMATTSPTYTIYSDGDSAIPGNGNAPQTSGIYDSSGTQLYAGVRSYNVLVLTKADGSVVSHTSYDVYGSAANAATLVSDIQALPTDGSQLIIVYTHDEPQTNRLTNNLPSTIYDLGGSSSVFESSEFYYRGAYVLIGERGLGEGNGYFEALSGSEDSDPNAWLNLTYPFNYLPLGFKASLPPASDQTGIPQATINLDMIDQRITKMLRTITEPANVIVHLLRKPPTGAVVAEFGPLDMSLGSAQYNRTKAQLSLGFETDYMNQSAVADHFDPSVSPALFGY